MYFNLSYISQSYNKHSPKYNLSDVLFSRTCVTFIYATTVIYKNELYSTINFGEEKI